MSPSTTSQPNARHPDTIDAPPGVRGQRRPATRRPATRRRTSQDHRGVHYSSLTAIDERPRRATQDHSIFLSLQSDCIARLNSIHSHHDEPDRFENSSYSRNDSHVGSKGMEVMDLRPSAHLRLSDPNLDSSLITLSSNNSMDSELASGMKSANGVFPVVGSGVGGGDTPLRGDLPTHWAASGVGDSDHSYRAIMSLMRSGDKDKKGSFVNWSALTAPPGDGSSKLWDELESSSKSTESSLLADKKKRPQKRRCARAIVGLMALAALSGSVSYFISEKGYRSMFEFLPCNNLLGMLLGNGNKNSEEQHDEKDDQLMYRMLPKGGNVVEMVSTYPSVLGDLGNDHYDKDISPQERESRARGQLILAHEHRAQQEARAQEERTAVRKTMRERQVHEHHVRAQQEHRALEERPAGRKTTTHDEGYHNGAHQDYPTDRQRKLLLQQKYRTSVI